MYLFYFIFVFYLLPAVICSPKCEDFVTCGTCVLNTFDECQWCSADNHKGNRCQPKKVIDEKWCTKNKIINKPDIKVNVIRDDPWSSGENKTEIIQFRPQNVIIKSASPGVPVNVTMSYKPAKDAPLDIYFLIDNSGNIAKYKKFLTEQATSIFEEVKNYTNNVRIGTGTFVEKPALPYANPDKQNVYTFKNHLSLTNNAETFKGTLKKIEKGANYDFPEDIFDGLMQVMLCKEEINWRKDARRIIVVITNAFYHSAGDGKMVGAFKRHDMKCHEDDKMDTLMDYPSIAQVNKVAKDNGYIIIFAFVDDDAYNVEDHYQLLSQKINEAKYVKLSGENIAKMIKEEYIKIIEDVNFVYESSSNIQITINKKCQICKAMHSNPLEFVATINVISCPNPLKDREIIKITPTSLTEQLHVEVEFNCQCDCETNVLTEFNSTKCKTNGDYQCGICKCKSDRSGDDCACESGSFDFKGDNDNCRKNSNDAVRCSGHGECSCGKCESCYEGFSGPFCEYDVNACPRPGRKVCSDHGECKMGICECYPNWDHSLSGIKDCGCSLDQRTCTAPHSDKVCSGNGECSCGKCICTKMVNSNDTCTGRFCDKCSWFAAKRCEELEDYAYCKYLNQTSCQDKYDLTDTIVLFANRSEINSPRNIEWYMANWCRVQKDESIFVFKYYYSSPDTNAGAGSNETLILVIQKELDEKPPANIWVAVGSAIGGILLIGLLSLLLWKVITHIYDEREYNQFVEKALAAGYNVNMIENPWYEPPTMTFINPTHRPQ